MQEWKDVKGALLAKAGGQRSTQLATTSATYFAQSLTAISGDIKIMVVNTERGLPSENMGGSHWFVVA